MTKQILAFLFCFIRELTLYSPLTLSLRLPIRPYLIHLTLRFIVKQKNYERASNYYSRALMSLQAP